MKTLLITFSGGRSSAFLARYIQQNNKYDKYNKIYLFANTGKEMTETLDFIKKCSDEWNMNIIWLEAKVDMKKGVATTFNIVDYKTASRKGEPFEEMLKKYTMPNNFASNCTRELKDRPIKKYIKSLGIKDYIMTMGIRFDEQHRRSISAEKNNIIYPLMDEISVDKKFIRMWWNRQPFDLGIKDYEGNCDLCFKKSVRKRLTLIKENPSILDWWLKMEKKYSSDKVPRFDLRSNLSIEQLEEMSCKPFKSVKDENFKDENLLFDVDLDFETDCYCKAN